MRAQIALWALRFYRNLHFVPPYKRRSEQRVQKREAYKGTLSEETAIEKEHKKEEIRRISTIIEQQSIKIKRGYHIFVITSLFLGYA